MRTRNTVNSKKLQVVPTGAEIAAQTLEQTRGPDILALLQFGSQAILKQADAVAEMYVTGVSTRKVKKALKAVAGDDVRLSRSTVSRITKRLRVEYGT